MPARRLKGISGPGVVFVTTTIADWQPLLRSPRGARIATQYLGDVVQSFSADLIGYVIMPDHVHFLSAIPDITSLSRFVQTYKSLSSRAIARQSASERHLPGTVWMRRFDDLIVRSEKQFIIKLRYIHQNPVRARLVDDAVDWEFSSARQWATGEVGPIAVDTSFKWVEKYDRLQS